MYEGAMDPHCIWTSVHRGREPHARRSVSTQKPPTSSDGTSRIDGGTRAAPAGLLRDVLHGRRPVGQSYLQMKTLSAALEQSARRS